MTYYTGVKGLKCQQEEKKLIFLILTEFYFFAFPKQFTKLKYYPNVNITAAILNVILSSIN